MRALAHASDRPLVLYDVPGRVGAGIADATVAVLFERDIIGGIKDATADVARVPRLRSLCGPDLLQFSGDDATAAAHRAMGGHGCISVTANVAPALCALLHQAWDAGDLAAFATTRDRLALLSEALFVESNPIPLKAALAMLGLALNELRLPLTRASEATVDRLSPILTAVIRAEDAMAAKPRHAVAA
jgi:4-hydroxy-tetrahydrodipicolinate synthase